MKIHHWSVCNACNGEGRIPLGPSKRRKRKFSNEFELFEKSPSKYPKPAKPKPILSMCLVCNGSGLKKSENLTQITTEFPHIAIIGAGIAGTALAIACMHRGISCTLYERDNNINDRAQGYGLTLQQASKSIAALGITGLDNTIISTRHVVHDSGGNIIGEWGLRKWRGENVPDNKKRKNIHISRQSLRKQFIDQLDQSCIQWGHRLKDFTENTQGGFDINFETDNRQVTYQADIIVGADGIRSKTREIISGKNNDNLNYLDCMVMLGICSLDSIDMQSDLLDSKTVFQTVDGTHRIYIMPYDDDHVMWQFSYLISEERAILLQQSGPKKMKGIIMNKVALWHDPIKSIIKNTNISDITGYPVYDRSVPVLKPSKYNNDIVLIGDAAHPMSPFKGQGANQAILDSLSLARAIYAKGKNTKNYRKNIFNELEKQMFLRVYSKVFDSRSAVIQLHSKKALRKNSNTSGRQI